MKQTGRINFWETDEMNTWIQKTQDAWQIEPIIEGLLTIVIGCVTVYGILSLSGMPVLTFV